MARRKSRKRQPSTAKRRTPSAERGARAKPRYIDDQGIPAGVALDQNGGPVDIDEARLALTRQLATYLGRPAGCRLAACRRRKRCVGDPRACAGHVRDESEMTREERRQSAETFARFRRALDARLAEIRAAER